MKKIIFMALAAFTISMVLSSCEEPNTPKDPHETYYNSAIIRY